MNAEQIADKLLERAKKYEEPFGKQHAAFVQSSSYAIATALRDVAYVIRASAKPGLDIQKETT